MIAWMSQTSLFISDVIPNLKNYAEAHMACNYMYINYGIFILVVCSEPKVGSSILSNVLEMVGNTPLVRLDKIAKMEGLECELRK